MCWRQLFGLSKTYNFGYVFLLASYLYKLEYILVHEMVHLLERSHNERFRSLMDTVMPNWRLFREELNRAPLAHEKWKY